MARLDDRDKSTHLHVERSGDHRLIVYENLGRVVAARKTARTLKSEIRRGRHVVRHLLSWLVDYPLAVLPSHTNRPRARAARQHGQVNGVVRRKRRGEAADGLVRIQGSAELDG